MGKPAIKALKDYDIQRKSNPEEYTFDPLKLGIKGATFWERRIEKNKLK
jgi:AGCS family alanine or glycine:cation symporter